MDLGVADEVEQHLVAARGDVVGLVDDHDRRPGEEVRHLGAAAAAPVELARDRLDRRARDVGVAAVEQARRLALAGEDPQRAREAGRQLVGRPLEADGRLVEQRDLVREPQHPQLRVALELLQEPAHGDVRLPGAGGEDDQAAHRAGALELVERPLRVQRVAVRGVERVTAGAAQLEDAAGLLTRPPLRDQPGRAVLAVERVAQVLEEVLGLLARLQEGDLARGRRVDVVGVRLAERRLRDVRQARERVLAGARQPALEQHRREAGHRPLRQLGAEHPPGDLEQERGIVDVGDRGAAVGQRRDQLPQQVRLHELPLERRAPALARRRLLGAVRRPVCSPRARPSHPAT